MKKPISVILLFLFCLTGCEFKDSPVFFSEVALQDKFITLSGQEVSLASILDKNKGKTIVIDIWASWCKDCIVGMSKLKQLQSDHPEVNFIFLSLDRSEANWKKGIKKYELKGHHYYMQSGMKGALGRFVDLDWIPRYMVVNKQQEIKIFKAINAGDINVKKILDQIK